MYDTLQLALRNLYRQRHRSGVAVASIVFGVVALLLAGGFIEWGLWFGRDSTIHSQLGHLQVTRQDYYLKGIADPFEFQLPADDSKEFTSLKALTGVSAMGPRLALSGLISLGDASISFIGEGVSPAAESELSRSLVIRAGKGLAEEDPKGLIIGQGLAANLGARVGDTVVLMANTSTGGINAVEMHIRGVFSTITKAYDDAALRLPISTARKLLKVQGAHIWAILLEDTDTIEAHRKQILATLPQNHFQVLLWRELADFYNKTEALLTKQFATVKLIIAAIILLSVTNTMMMSVMERTSEIGTSMALGIPQKSIMAQFVAEGLILGLFGATVGLVLGFILSLVISYIGIPMPPPPGMADAYTARILVTPALAAETFLVVVVTTLAASIYPAWKASRMNIVDCLRTAT